ncbi:MAG: DNA polymerase III subunit chi [Alphaproteobacteria bacterium]|nr:DNA polymerase III subunit chi [Alphaproteobacteria bacterium]
MEVSFYELTTTSVEKMLPKLLEKVYSSQQRAVVLLDSEERLGVVNAALWTYSTLAFLPHGSIKEDAATRSRQPIWLTTTLENPNQADVLVVTTGGLIEEPDAFKKCLDVFEGTLDENKTRAQQRQSHYKAAGIPCVYWRQNSTGGWDAGT